MRTRWRLTEDLANQCALVDFDSRLPGLVGIGLPVKVISSAHPASLAIDPISDIGAIRLVCTGFDAVFLLWKTA